MCRKSGIFDLADGGVRKRLRGKCHCCTVHTPLQGMTDGLAGEALHQSRLRPYRVEHTSSRPITAVKQRRARLVLAWVTSGESRVL